MKFLKDHPTIGGAILSLAGAILGLFIHNADMVAALVGSAGIFLGLHQVVTPVTTAATHITDAACQAATQVAAELNRTTVGTIGEVTEGGKEIVDNAVNTVVGGVLGKLGLKQSAPVG